MERVQHRFTRMTEGFSSLLYGERLLRLGLWTLEERINRRDLIEMFKMFYGYTEMNIRVYARFVVMIRVQPQDLIRIL